MIVTDGSSVTYPEGLRDIARPLEEAGVKVILVLVEDTNRGLNNIKPLASGDEFIVAVGSPDRLKEMVRPTINVILKGKREVLLFCFSLVPTTYIISLLINIPSPLRLFGEFYQPHMRARSLIYIKMT